MKNRNFAEKEENSCSQTNSQSVPKFQKQTILRKSGVHKPSTETDSLPGEQKTGNGRKKCRKPGCSTFGKFNLVGQISAVAAFKQLQVKTFPMIYHHVGLSKTF